MTRARDVANLIGSGNYSSTTFTATAGQTAFTISHTQGFIQVFMNGLLLDETVDYTSNGSAVTLTSGAAAGDEIEVVAYNTFSVGDALNQAAADTRYVNASGDTMTGNLTISSTAGQLKLTDTDGTEQNTTIKQSGGNLFIQARDNTNNAGIVFAGNGGGNYSEHMRINASGQITKPQQPMFHAWCTDGGNGAVSGGSSPTSFYVSLNVGSHFSSGTFTAPIAGKYRFYAGILSGSTNGYGLYQFTVNNSGSFGGGINTNWGQGYNYGTSNDKLITKELLVNLSANDYVKLQVSSSNTNLYWAAGYSYFGGHLIG